MRERPRSTWEVRVPSVARAPVVSKLMAVLDRVPWSARETDSQDEEASARPPHPSKARISFPEDEDGPRRRLVSPMVDGGGGSTMAHQASLSEVDPEIVLAASIFVEELVERAAQEVN